MDAKTRFGNRQVVFNQCRRGFHEARVLGRRLDMGGTRSVRSVRVADEIEVVGEQPPGINRIRFQLQRAAQSADGVRGAPRFAQRHRKFDVRRCRVRLFARERRKYFDGGLRVSRTSMRCAQNEPRMGVPRDGFKDFVRLFYSEPGIPLQKSCSMTKCNIERSNRLRNAVQLSIQLIPVAVMSL